MGEAVYNVEVVKDYTPNKSFLRLHMDLPIPPEDIELLRKLCDAGDFDRAYELIRRANPSLRHTEMLDAAFAYLKELRRSGESLAPPFEPTATVSFQHGCMVPGAGRRS